MIPPPSRCFSRAANVAALVSPGLAALVSDDAPTRAILCAGGGHFATAAIGLSRGRFVGRTADAGTQVVADWSQIAEREGDVVPDYGFVQAEREVVSATGNQL